MHALELGWTGGDQYTADEVRDAQLSLVEEAADTAGAVAVHPAFQRSAYQFSGGMAGKGSSVPLLTLTSVPLPSPYIGRRAGCQRPNPHPHLRQPYPTSLGVNHTPGAWGGAGAYGEAWRGMALDGRGTAVVLKRLFLQLGGHAELQGAREIFFGCRLAALPADRLTHVARYVAHFRSASCGRRSELWLVYRDEGTSLYQIAFRVRCFPRV
jgi:hypothetical protein